MGHGVWLRSRVVELPGPKKLKEHTARHGIPQTAKAAGGRRRGQIDSIRGTYVNTNLRCRNVNNYDYNNNNKGLWRGGGRKGCCTTQSCPTPWVLLVAFPFACSISMRYFTLLWGGILISISIIERDTPGHTLPPPPCRCSYPLSTN